MHTNGQVISVSRSPSHSFSKCRETSIHLIAGVGVEGDAHSGHFVQNRYLKRREPMLVNSRQVHLIAFETLEFLSSAGFNIRPGDLGENIMTVGIDLSNLPLGSWLRVGNVATLRLTGLRTTCSLIDRFQKSLRRASSEFKSRQDTLRGAAFGVVINGGMVAQGDKIAVSLPSDAVQSLPPM